MEVTYASQAQTTEIHVVHAVGELQYASVVFALRSQTTHIQWYIVTISFGESCGAVATTVVELQCRISFTPTFRKQLGHSK